MKLEAPPSRYSVVERGRRLVVVDRGTAPISQLPTLRTTRRRPGRPGPIRITTLELFDAKGPRTIALDSIHLRQAMVAAIVVLAALLAAIALLNAAPAVAVPVLLILATRQTRAKIRDRITRWLDTA